MPASPFVALYACGLIPVRLYGLSAAVFRHLYTGFTAAALLRLQRAGSPFACLLLVLISSPVVSLPYVLASLDLGVDVSGLRFISARRF